MSSMTLFKQVRGVFIIQHLTQLAGATVLLVYSCRKRLFKINFQCPEEGNTEKTYAACPGFECYQFHHLLGGCWIDKTAGLTWLCIKIRACLQPRCLKTQRCLFLQKRGQRFLLILPFHCRPTLCPPPCYSWGGGSSE